MTKFDAMGRPAALKRGVHAALRRVGVDIVRYDAARFPELRRARLVSDRKVDLVLDVGANDGPFATELRAAGYRGRIVSFEPQAAAFGRLAAASSRDSLWEASQLAIGIDDGTAELNVAGNSSSSSLLGMTDQHLESAPESRYVRTETVQVARLDSLADGLVRSSDRVYLKIDVQGLELEVLRGAERTLGHVVAVDCELSLVPLYDGAPLLPEVVDFLASRGFALQSLEPVFADPETGRLLQVDGLFARSA